MALKEMKKTEANTVALEITVDADTFEKGMQSSYLKNVQKMNVPGFRKGKAPRGMLEKMYGAEIFYEDAVNDTYYGAYVDAVKEAGIEPVDAPKVELKDNITSEGYTFTATVTVKPEVELGEYSGIKVEKVVVPVTEADVQAEIDKLREKYSRLVDAGDAPAAKGDTVIIDFEGFIDGNSFEGGKGENHSLKLGANQFIPGFEDQLVGKKAGDEVDVNVSFPEDYHAEELKGKPAVFKVKINETKKTELPEINDEFVKDISEYDTAEAFINSIKEGIVKQRDAYSDNEMTDDLLEQVVKGMKAEIPDVMITGQLESIVNDYDQRLKQQGMDLKTYLQYTGQQMEDFEKMFRPQAETQVKTRLALEAVAVKENIVVSEEELDEEYKKLAEAYKMEADKLKLYVPVSELSKDLAVQKALEFIKSHAEITEVSEKSKKEANTEAKKEKAAAKKTTKKTSAKKEKAKEE